MFLDLVGRDLLSGDGRDEELLWRGSLGRRGARRFRIVVPSAITQEKHKKNPTLYQFANCTVPVEVCDMLWRDKRNAMTFCFCDFELHCVAGSCGVEFLLHHLVILHYIKSPSRSMMKRSVPIKTHITFSVLKKILLF